MALRVEGALGIVVELSRRGIVNARLTAGQHVALFLE